MTEDSTERRGSDHGAGGASAVGLGAVLVIVGILLLGGQLLDVGIGDLGWPLIIVAIGVALFLIGLVAVRESGMVVGGSVVTTIGLILLFQDRTGLWATWAYAWALLPAASGLGLAIWGVRTADGKDIRNGFWGFLGGMSMFAIAFLFFEGIIGLSGDRLPIADWVLPAVVIGIGVVILARGLLQRGEPSEPSAS